MYYHPIFNGDWPPVVKARVAERSKKEGYKKSRLPQFTSEEIKFIKGTHDYLAINHYFTFLAGEEPEAPYTETHYENDVRVINSRMPNWELGSNSWAVSRRFNDSEKHNHINISTSSSISSETQILAYYLHFCS